MKVLKQKQRKGSGNSSRLPAEFQKPIKVKQYQEFNREEIYQEWKNGQDLCPDTLYEDSTKI